MPAKGFICFLWLLKLAHTFGAHLDSDSLETVADLRYRNLAAVNFNSIKNLCSNALYLNLQGNNLQSIPSDVSTHCPQLERAILTDNPRLSFPADGSPFLISPTLIELFCESCGIRVIFNRSLRHLPRLEQLWLSNNRIRYEGKHAFRWNVYLHSLDLSSNELSTLPTRMLDDLFYVKDVDLSNNRQLAPINDVAFLASDVLEVVKCNHCGFTEIYDSTFSKLTNLKQLQLKGNRISTIPYLLTPMVVIVLPGSKVTSAETFEQHGLVASKKKRALLWWKKKTKVYV